MYGGGRRLDRERDRPRRGRDERSLAKPTGPRKTLVLSSKSQKSEPMGTTRLKIRNIDDK